EGRDPWLSLLFPKGKTRWIAGAILLISIVVPLVAAWVNGTLINPNLKVDAVRDVGYFDVMIVLFPFVCVFAVYYLNGLEPAFIELRSNGIAIMSDETYDG